MHQPVRRTRDAYVSARIPAAVGGHPPALARFRAEALRRRILSEKEREIVTSI